MRYETYDEPIFATIFAHNMKNPNLDLFEIKSLVVEEIHILYMAHNSIYLAYEHTNHRSTNIYKVFVFGKNINPMAVVNVNGRITNEDSIINNQFALS